MNENTNKSIAYNSVVMMARLAITTLCGLLTTRFALQALGVTDFGLFALVGSIIMFISVFNSVMLNTSNRFISVSVGRGDERGVNEQFNISLTIHAFIALFTLLLGLPAGHWYIDHYVNFDGDIVDAHHVFSLTLVGSALSFVGVPYNGLLSAKEKFIVFSAADVFVHVAKTAIAFSLISYFTHKLLVYALSQALLTALPTLVYYVYCNRKYPRLVKVRLVRSWQKYRQVLSFSSWVAFGAFITIFRDQGVAMIVNVFFNTAMNAALGIATTVRTLITLVANNVWFPMAPQITKSYAAGDSKRCEDLLVMSTKFTFLAMLFVSVPFLTDTEWIFTLWLGQVPPYALSFTVLMVVDSLIGSLNLGISSIIFASGKIKLYQVTVNVLRLLSVIAAYVALSQGAEAPSLFYCYIVFSAIIFFASQWVLHKTLHYKNSVLVRRSYVPSFIVTLCFMPVCLFRFDCPPLMRIVLSMLYLLALVYMFGLSKRERSFINQTIRQKLTTKSS